MIFIRNRINSMPLRDSCYDSIDHCTIFKSKRDNLMSKTYILDTLQVECSQLSNFLFPGYMHFGYYFPVWGIQFFCISVVNAFPTKFGPIGCQPEFRVQYSFGLQLSCRLHDLGLQISSLKLPSFSHHCTWICLEFDTH